MTSWLVAVLVASGTPTEAERLFSEGRAKFKAEKVSEACRLFERSQQLEPALGTLLNLAICLEAEGRLASAYLKLNEAVAWAGRTHEAGREELARTHLKAIRPRLSFLTVKADKPVAAMTLSVAGLELPLSAGPQTLPVDPGPVALKVSAPGFSPWSSEVRSPSEGQTSTVVVPALAVDAAVASASASLAPSAPVSDGPPATFSRPPVMAPSPVAAAPPVVSKPSPAAPPQAAPGGSRVGGVAGVVVGSAVLVAGAAGLGWSYSTNAALIAQQPGGPQANNPTVTREQFETMKWLYPASWAAVGVGAATVAVSLYFTLRPEPPSVVSVAPMPGGGMVMLSGHFDLP